MTKEETILPTLKLVLNTATLPYFASSVFSRARLEVSEGKSVHTKISISSGVNLWRTYCSTTYNGDDEHVSALNLE